MDVDMSMQMGGFMAGWMALWGLLAVALLVLAVVATVWLVKDLTTHSRRHGLPQEELRR